MIEEAREQFPEIDFRVDDIAASDLPSDEFDYVIFSFYGLDYVIPKRRREVAIREVNRV